MKFVVGLAVVVAVAIVVVLKSGMLDTNVDCPACQGSGRQLPGEEECGDETERPRIPPISDKFAFCYSSHQCPYCEGKGQVKDSQAAEIPDAMYMFDNVVGESSAVLE